MHNHGRRLPRYIVCNCDVCAVFGTIASGEQCHIITQLYCLGSKLESLKQSLLTMIELIVRGYYHLLLVAVSLAIVGFWLEVVAV